MHQVWETFKEAGWISWLILLIGLVGGAASLAAIVVAAMRHRAALVVGTVCVSLGISCAALGVFGVLRGRAVTDGAIEGASIRPIQKERIRREGYRESRSAAKVGLFFAAFPLLVGAAAMFASPRRRADGTQGPGLGVPAGVTLAGLLTAGLAFAYTRAPLPGRDIDAVDPVWGLLDAVDQIQNGQDGEEVLWGCRALDEVLMRSWGPADLARVPDLPAAQVRCVDERLRQAKASPDPVRALLDLMASDFVTKHPEQKQRVQDALGQLLGVAGGAEPPRPAGLSFGRLALSASSLPEGSVDRILRQNLGTLRACFADAGVKDQPSHITFRFGIWPQGEVKRLEVVSGDSPAVACLTPKLERIKYPFGGHANVTVPLHFVPEPAGAPP